MHRRPADPPGEPPEPREPPEPIDAVPAAIDPGRRAFATWLWRLPVLVAAGGAAFGMVQAYRIHFAKDLPDPRPVFDDAAPTEVAPLASFARPWDGREFVMAGVPGVAVRLPAPIPGGLSSSLGVHLAAFSRVCTHQACIVELNRDTEVVAFAFNHRSDRPSLTCACHFSVFDPLRAGRAVSGPAVRPLPRIRLRLEGEEGSGNARVVADGLERSG
jgi:arsenite oxidase small subunit